MLRCAGNRIYTGYAVDVEARFRQHAEGRGAKFTKAFPPECVLRHFEFETREEALRMEARIKKLPREKKEALALGDADIEMSLRSTLGELLVKKRKPAAKRKSGQCRIKSTTR